MAQHRLVFDKRAIAQEETQKQITRIFDKRGALPRDDRVDCLASAVSHWEDILSLDVDRIIEKNHEKNRQDVVKTWLNDDRRMGLWSDRLSGAVRVPDMPNLPKRARLGKWSARRNMW